MIEGTLSDVAQMVAESLDRLLADAEGKLAADCSFDTGLWRSVRDAGIADALAMEAGTNEDAGLGMEGALNLVALAARRAAPIPLAEHFFATWFAARCGLDTSAGLIVPAGLGIGDTVSIAADGVVSGTAFRVPFARHASQVLAISADRVALCELAGLAITTSENTADEPRDRLDFAGSGVVAELPLPLLALRASFAGLRAIQIAGALQTVLRLTAGYVQERVQFGRPIAKFQAVQQAIAELGGQVASAQAASQLVPAAFGHADRVATLAAAKVRTGDAVGPCSRIAHQAHGAIGYTQEYALHRFTQRLWSWREDCGSDGWWARWLGHALAYEGAEQLWPLLTNGLCFTPRTAVG